MRQSSYTDFQLIAAVQSSTSIRQVLAKLGLAKAGGNYSIVRRRIRQLDLPLPLELDHINGERSDNRIENPGILCPNCHALTETYRGKKLAKCRDETAPS